MAKRKRPASPGGNLDPQCILDAHKVGNLAPILEIFPTLASQRLRDAMVARSATSAAADQATAKMRDALADWLYSGGHRALDALPDAQVKAELERVAKAARELEAVVSGLSIGASVRLRVSLQREGQGPWSSLQSQHWNADPIEVDRPHGGLLSDVLEQRGLLPKKIIVPPNLAAKFSRFHMDLIALAEPMQRAARFTAKKSADHRREHLFRQAIRAWTDAVQEWPTAGQADLSDDLPGNMASSPIPGALREMAAAVLGIAPRSLNDSAFRRVLKTEKERANEPRGLLRLPRGPKLPSPARGRPARKK